MMDFFKKKNIEKFRNYIIEKKYSCYYNKNPLKIKVLSIAETLDYILDNNSSVVRYGDGEISLIEGNDIVFQSYNKELVDRLKTIANTDNNDEFLVCLPDVFSTLDLYVPKSKKIWAINRHIHRGTFEKLFTGNFYGNSFISRPYQIYKDKEPSEKYFTKMKKIWEKKDLLIVEGKNSRTGVGNDLFSNTNSIRRIICPSKDAYDIYDEILEEIIKECNDKLIFIMLGPTAKFLVHDLYLRGYQAIDLGHIDTEYEWFKMSATEKVRIPNKHTAEFVDNIVYEYNEKYESEILSDLTYL